MLTLKDAAGYIMKLPKAEHEAPVMTFTWKGYGDPRCGCRMRKPGRCRTMQRRARGTAPFRGAVKRQAAL
jgi:hypothetical protein